MITFLLLSVPQKNMCINKQAIRKLKHFWYLFIWGTSETLIILPDGYPRVSTKEEAREYQLQVWILQHRLIVIFLNNIDGEPGATNWGGNLISNTHKYIWLDLISINTHSGEEDLLIELYMSFGRGLTWLASLLHVLV